MTAELVGGWSSQRAGVRWQIEECAPQNTAGAVFMDRGNGPDGWGNGRLIRLPADRAWLERWGEEQRASGHRFASLSANELETLLAANRRRLAIGVVPSSE